MGENETTKKPQNKFTDIFKVVAAGAGSVCSGGVGSIILWGGGLAVAAAITAFSVKITKKNKKKKKQSHGKVEGASKKNGSTEMIRDIEEECINRFRLALHNPSQSLHHHVWSPLSLSKMKIQGQEIVSTRYLISEDKIVLQVEWRQENSTASSKEEIVIFDNLKTHKITSSDDILSLDQPALQMLPVGADDFAGKDPLGTIIQTIKDNRRALEQIVNAKHEQEEEGECPEQIEESSMEENETNGEDANEQGSAFIPREMGTAKTGILQQTINKMRMQAWVFLVVVVMLILLASPKLLTY